MPNPNPDLSGGNTLVVMARKIRTYYHPSPELNPDLNPDRNPDLNPDVNPDDIVLIGGFTDRFYGLAAQNVGLIGITGQDHLLQPDPNPNPSWAVDECYLWHEHLPCTCVSDEKLRSRDVVPLTLTFVLCRLVGKHRVHCKYWG